MGFHSSTVGFEAMKRNSWELGFEKDMNTLSISDIKRSEAFCIA